MGYFVAAFAAAFLSFLLVPMIRVISARLHVLDHPGPRKIHTIPIPLLGGVAIFISFFLVLSVAWLYGKGTTWYVSPYSILALFGGSVVLMLGGALDDKYNLPPAIQFLFPFLAALTATLGGVGVHQITNPFGGVISLTALWWVPLLFSFVWLMGMMYTTKFLDGLDGLASGIVAIGALLIFALTQTHKYFQPDVGFIAIIFAGALMGFLVWNFHRAKIFLGEGGSLFIGYILGALAIISGGKIATALLAVGVPVFDAAFVIVRRALNKKSPVRGDLSHFHFQLLHRGLSQRKVVLLYYLVAAGVGVTTLFLQSREKLIALALLGIAMAAIWGSSFLKR